MSIKEYQLETLRILQEYMPQVRMIPDLINSLENRGLKELLPRQKDTLTSLIHKSSKRNEIAERVSNIGKPVNKSNKSNKSNTSNTSNVTPEYFKSPIVKKLEELIIF